MIILSVSVNADELRKALSLAMDIIHSKGESLQKLQYEVEHERGQNKILRHEIQNMRKQAIQLQLTAETEEEYISNTLLKRIATMKKEKDDLMLEVDREEEYLTNTLQKKLDKLQKEKVDLENALEQEQERLVNQLQRQLDFTRTLSPNSASVSIASSPGGGSLPMLGMSPSTPSPHKRGPSQSVDNGLVEMLKADINSLRLKVTDLEKELVSKYNQSQVYKRELLQLRRQLGLSTANLHDDDLTPNVIRLLFPDRPVRARRSMSSSQSDRFIPTGYLSHPSLDQSRFGLMGGTSGGRYPDYGNTRRTSDIGLIRTPPIGVDIPFENNSYRTITGSAPVSHGRAGKRPS
ncbi:hypothetical protein IWQ61_006899 [Dispira simplex]|nr:hypothetical protein IWQ61_006899 [Dispira simplex]